MPLHLLENLARLGRAITPFAPHISRMANGERLTICHRHAYTILLRELLSLFISRVGMANDPHTRISREHALDAPGHLVATISNGDLSGVQRVANAHAAAVVNRNPRRSGGRVQQSIQQRPIGDRVRAVLHALSLAKRRRHRAAIEMIAANHDRRFDLPLLHQIVYREAELRALAVSQPADTRRQSLKLDALARQ